MKSLHRAVDLLLAFLDGPSLLSVPELAARTELPASTVYRVLGGLRQKGLVAVDATVHKYRLGPTVFRLGMVAGTFMDLRQIARPIMERLARASGESSFLSIRSGSESVYLESVESPAVVRFTATLGRRTPLHAGASAKVLLAFLPDPERDELVSALTLTKLTANTITAKARLLARLASIRERGYDFSDEEAHQGAWGLAAPVYDEGGRIVASLAIAGLKFRLNRGRLPELTRLVQSSAQELSHHFRLPPGGPTTPPARVAPLSGKRVKSHRVVG